MLCLSPLSYHIIIRYLPSCLEHSVVMFSLHARILTWIQTAQYPLAGFFCAPGSSSESSVNNHPCSRPSIFQFYAELPFSHICTSLVSLPPIIIPLFLLLSIIHIILTPALNDNPGNVIARYTHTQLCRLLVPVLCSLTPPLICPESSVRYLAGRSS